jgi:hypothetical protein
MTTCATSSLPSQSAAVYASERIVVSTEDSHWDWYSKRGHVNPKSPSLYPGIVMKTILTASLFWRTS